MEETFRNFSRSEDCPLSSQQQMALSTIDVLTFLIGIQMTSKLLWIGFKSKKPADILNFNLALLHTVHYLLCILHLIIIFSLPNDHMVVLKFLWVYAEIAGPMSLSFICAERYVAVVHPTSYYLLTKYKCRGVCAAMVWLWAVPSALVGVVGEGKLSNLEQFLREFPFCVMWVMTVLMIMCTIRIAWALKRSGPGRDSLHPVKKRAFIVVCATSAITLSCYIPMTGLQRFRPSDECLYKCIVVPLCVSLLSAASVVHPMFYLHSQGMLLPCLKGRKKAG